MSNQISSQATKVWQVVSSPDTGNTYKQALAITWLILKETGILLWFVICLVLVAFDWFWTNSIYTGRRVRVWWDSVDQSDTSGIASEASRAFLEASKNSLTYALAQAREQLGLPEKQDPVLPEPTKEPAIVQPAPVESVADIPPFPAKPVEEVAKPTKTTAPPATPSKDDVDLS